MTTKRLCIHLLLPSHQILRPWSKPRVFDFASNIPLHEPHLRPGRVVLQHPEYAMLGLKLDDTINWSICHSLNADAHTLQSRCRHLHRVVYLHQKDPVKVAIPSDCHAQNFLISSASFSGTLISRPHCGFYLCWIHKIYARGSACYDPQCLSPGSL